jgi:DNA repair protein RecO (recombination protein O)
MMTTVKGLIIKETKVGEGDKIITLLTPELGIIQVSAKGARSYKSKYIAACQLFGYCEFVLSKKGKWYSVVSAEPIHTFYDLRTSLDKLSLAAYFCSLLGEVCTDSRDADKALRLALNTFYMLVKNDDLSRIKATFELRLMSDSGFAPELDCCVKCGQKGEFAGFSVFDGGVLCGDCKGGKGISKAALSAMRYIISAAVEKVFAYRTDDGVLSELESIAQEYTLSHIGHDFSSLKYYLTIRKNMI